MSSLRLTSSRLLAPDGEVGQQAFAVIRDAIRKEGMVALGEGTKDEKIPKDMLDLALHIVETKRGDFDPEP
jgi:non-homologous end joining protein Ku